jgi:hypothetical protein
MKRSKPPAKRRVRNIYQQLQPMNFSREFLEPLVKNYPSNLVALPVPDLLWSDWGTTSRIVDVLARIGKVPRLNDSRRTTGKKIASGYPFVRQLLAFDRDLLTHEVAVQKEIRPESFPKNQTHVFTSRHKKEVLWNNLLIILVLVLIGALPAWPYSSGWGYYPSGGLGSFCSL